MIKKEKHIQKSGQKNPNRYKFNPLDYIKNKKFVIAITILFAIFLILDLICLLGITSWNRIFTATGIVDGVKPQDSNFVIYYLDVGQSDCSIVICDDEVMMIDSGTVNQVYNIRTNLFTLELDTIDYLLITHQHDDHFGGAAEIISNYTVSKILMPKLSNINSVNSSTYSNLIEKIYENNVQPLSVASGDSFKLGSADIEILAPIKQDKDLNNMSAVIKITYGNTSFLFTGDNNETVEKQLLRNNLDVSANVLKIGHHGSKNSSSKNFLKAVDPKYAIISSGYDNNFGHPNDLVLERLHEHDIIPYITSLHGSITVTSDGNQILIYSENNI